MRYPAGDETERKPTDTAAVARGDINMWNARLRGSTAAPGLVGAIVANRERSIV
jgi:hypothetical protein